MQNFSNFRNAHVQSFQFIGKELAGMDWITRHAP